MTGIPKYAQPYFLELVSAYAAKGDEEAQRAMAKLPKKGKRKSLAPGRTKAQRAAEHRASTGDLRAIVAERMDGKCEACGLDVGPSWDMHHVIAAGERRSHQRPGSVLGICWTCHRAAHRGDLRVLNLIALAGPLDDGARKAATKRLGKVEEARRTA